MRIFGVALSVFCALVVANCGETTPHHIDQRILETQGLNSSTENNNITYTTTNFTTIQPVNNSSVVVTNAPSTEADASTKVTRKYVNITALLRNEDNVADIVLNKTYDNLVQNNSSPLVSVTNNQTTVVSKVVEPIDTEVDDLLNHNSQEEQGPLYEKQQHPIDSLEPIHFADNIDTDTELIEDGENTEDELRRIHNNYEVVERSPAVPLAIILVSVFVTMSVLSYAGLLLWRKYLEDRYGSRTLLVDAEEFSDPGDLKHFTI